LGGIYLAFLIAAGGWHLAPSGTDWGNVAQIATAFIATLAFGTAIYSVYSQREVARKRAAVDFFLKTDMDEKMFDMYRASRSAFQLLSMGVPPNGFDGFIKTDDYEKVYKYLNVHELLAVGIHKDVFDDYVAYAFWSDALIADYQDAEGLIAYIRETPGEGSHSTFEDLEKLYRRWRARKARETTGPAPTIGTVPRQAPAPSVPTPPQSPSSPT
jgi:hypothetical protein